MKITRQSHDRVLLQVLRRHQITRAHDRLLVGDMEAAWTREIGLCGCALLETVNRLAADGLFQRHETSAGPELELTERGAREIRMPRFPLSDAAAEAVLPSPVAPLRPLRALLHRVRRRCELWTLKPLRRVTDESLPPVWPALKPQRIAARPAMHARS